MLRDINFYITSFFISGICAIFIKLSRGNLFGINSDFDILLGSSPSFFYLFGVLSIVPVIHRKINVTTYRKYVLFIMAGGILYEMEQYWTSMIFDIGDVIATIFAGLLMLALHQKKRSSI